MNFETSRALYLSIKKWEANAQARNLDQKGLAAAQAEVDFLRALFPPGHAEYWAAWERLQIADSRERTWSLGEVREAQTEVETRAEALFGTRYPETADVI